MLDLAPGDVLRVTGACPHRGWRGLLVTYRGYDRDRGRLECLAVRVLSDDHNAPELYMLRPEWAERVGGTGDDTMRGR